jgi:hypothetical protein
MDEDDVKEIATNVYNTLGTQFGVAKIPFHVHNGTDTTSISFGDLLEKTRYIEYRAVGPTTAIAATTVGGDFVIPFAGYFLLAGATVDTAGTTGTMTVDIKKNGTSIFTTNLINIASGSKTSRGNATQPTITTTQFITGDIFTFVAGSIQTTPAQGLTIFMVVVEIP